MRLSTYRPVSEVDGFVHRAHAKSEPAVAYAGKSNRRDKVACVQLRLLAQAISNRLCKMEEI